MSYLIVAAHPDDEVLGAGATIHSLTEGGEEVNVCILSGRAAARASRPTELELEKDMRESSRLLGINRIILGDFPNIRMNTVPHLDLVRWIERAIEETNATTVFTHHPSDTNNDHLHTSLACQEAVRLFQRRGNIVPIKEFFYMEVPSSTEWSLNPAAGRFSPDTFIEVRKAGIDKKLEALRVYRGVMREFPHPRSEEGIMGLAAYRGSQSGCDYAEAFETAFRRGL